MRSYARNVKEMYWPKVSEEKKLEMEHLKDPSLRHSVLKLKQQLVNRNYNMGGISHREEGGVVDDEEAMKRR